jgi:HEAT repeat protein
VVEKPNWLLSKELIVLAERNVRASGYDANDIGELRLAATAERGVVRHSALTLLTERHGRGAIPTLVVALDDPQSLVRTAAARMLESLGDPNGLERMRKELTEFRILQELMETQRHDLQNSRVAEAPFRPLKRLSDALEAAEVLAEYGDCSGYQLAAQSALENEFAGIRWRAIAVLADLISVDREALQAAGCDPESILLLVAASEADPGVLGALIGCVLQHAPKEAQVRILQAIERSPYASDLSHLQRLALTNGLARARRLVEMQQRRGQ